MPNIQAHTVERADACVATTVMHLRNRLENNNSNTSGGVPEHGRRGALCS